MTLRERFEIRASRHGAVVVEDLDDHGGRLEAREPREIAARLGMAGARQHAAGLRHEREDVARLTQVLGRASRRTAVRIVCARSYAEMPVVTPSAASIDTVKFVRWSSVGVADHQRQAQLPAALARQREADQAAPVAGHEVDVLGPHRSRRP